MIEPVLTWLFGKPTLEVRTAYVPNSDCLSAVFYRTRSRGPWRRLRDPGRSYKYYWELDADAVKTAMRLETLADVKAFETGADKRPPTYHYKQS